MNGKSLKWQLVVLFVVIGFFIAACGPAPNSGTSEESVAGDTSSETAAETDSDESTTADSGLEYIEIEAGTGPQPQPGDLVRVHYTGTLEDGTEFDSSVDREPFSFTLGQGQVIAGWDEGIALMNEGGKALLIIPPELAYGEAGRGPIPSNATLTFEVELVEVVPAAASDAAPEVEDDSADAEPAEIEYIEIEEGTGEQPAVGDFVYVHYTGTLEDGTQFDSSEGGDPLPFILGQGQVIPGWDQGIALMKEGGKAQLIIPPELGYGPAGNGANIPPNATLIFDVELVDVVTPPDPLEVAEEDYTVTDSNLNYYEIEEGSGERYQPGDSVIFHYRLWLDNGTLVGSSIEQRQPPVQLTLGDGSIPPGLEEGILLMRPGGKAQMILPPEAGFGEVVIFEIEMIEFEAE